MTPATKRYKKELEEARRAQAAAEFELGRMKKKEKESKEKRWDLIVYCGNCLEVSSCEMPQTTTNTEVSGYDCVVCRYKGKLHIVRKVNCERTR